MIVDIKKLAISELIANFISLLWIESRLHRLTSGHDGCGLTQICASELKKPAAQVSEVLWLNMNVQSVQELTDRGSSQSGSWSLPLHSSLLRLFTLSSSSSRQSAEAQTGFSVPDSTLGSPPAGPVLKEGKIAPCWQKPQCGFFLFLFWFVRNQSHFWKRSFSTRKSSPALSMPAGSFIKVVGRSFGISKHGFPALPDFFFQCKSVRKVSCCFTHCRSCFNKVLKFAGDIFNLSNKTRISLKQGKNIQGHKSMIYYVHLHRLFFSSTKGCLFRGGCHGFTWS